MKHFYLLFFIFLSILYPSFAQVAEQTGFEPFSDEHEFLESSWETEGISVRWVNGFDQGRAFVDNAYSRSGENSLRIFYPAGEFGPGSSGVQAPIILPGEDEYYVSYWLRFSEDFSWGGTSEGGKLPGLAGGDNCSGCKTCVGTNGFSARLMWRPGGRAVLYLYHMDKTNTCGDNLDLKDKNGNTIYFEKGKWYNIVERVKVNSGNNYDGEVELWVNGEQALLVTGKRFVNNGDKVDNFYFSTFHGGGDSNWAPQNDCHIWFDDIVISTNREDVLIPPCGAPDLGPDVSICGASLPVTLDASLPETNRTFNWYKDNSFVGSGKTFNATEPGVYQVQADSSGCVTSDEIEVFSTIPQPRLGEDDEICEASYFTLDAGVVGDGLSYEWTYNGEILENQLTSTMETSKAGTYSVTVSADNCTPVTDEIVLSSGLLPVQGDTICKEGEVSLSVLQNGNYNWFLSEDAPSPVYSGMNYSPSVTENTTFYVEDANGFTGLVGKTAPDLGAGTYDDNQFDRRMKFTVFRNLSIDSVTVYLKDAGDVTVNVLANDNSTVVDSRVFSGLSAGRNRLNVAFTLAPGDYYMDGTGTTVELDYSNEMDGNINYPYSIPDVISITEAVPAWVTAKPWYMYFYNWRVSSGNSCARTPVAAIIDESDPECIITGKAPDKANSYAVYPNPFKEQINIVNGQKTFEVSVYSPSGKLVSKTQSSGGRVEVGKGLQPGVYFIEVKGGEGSEFIRVIKK